MLSEKSKQKVKDLKKLFRLAKVIDKKIEAIIDKLVEEKIGYFKR